MGIVSLGPRIMYAAGASSCLQSYSRLPCFQRDTDIYKRRTRAAMGNKMKKIDIVLVGVERDIKIDW